jgi:hypothetical protein
MAQLIFLRRTENEIKVFGGDVYIDIDGKNVGVLSRANHEMNLPAGEHTIKMYKSHSYDTFIGFAESKITLDEQEQLMVRYTAPMAVNQPGNLIITTYDPTKEAEALEDRERAIQRDYNAAENRKREQNEKYNTGVILFICFLIFDAIIWAIWIASI